MVYSDWLKPLPTKLANRYTHRRQKPRLPTEAEKQEVLDYLIQTGQDTEDQRSNLASMLFEDGLAVVFDSYEMYAGRYQGKLLTIISDMNPRDHLTFLWVDVSIREARKG